MACLTWSPVPALHRGADLPGHELVVAVAQQLALALLSGRHPQDRLEDLLALVFDRHAVEDIAAVDVHVVEHAAIDVVVGGELDGWRGLASVSRTATRREAQHVAAARHLARGSNRVVA